MPQKPDFRTPLEQVLDRLELCTAVIQEAHYRLEPPQDPERKADLLIAVETLASEALDLVKTTRTFVWGQDAEDPAE